MSGQADANITFEDLCWLLERFGFEKRVSGSHHVFSRANLQRPLNLQPRNDGKSKTYQVEQARQEIQVILDEGSAREEE